MRKRGLGLAAAVTLLAVGSLSYVAIGTHLYARYHLAYANYQFAPAGECGALVAWSPPTVLYSGLYVNQPELVAVRYRSPTPQALRISISIPSFTQDQTLQVHAAPAFQTLSFKPPLNDASVLDALVPSGERAGQLHLRVETEHSTVCDTTAPVRLLSRQWIHWGDSPQGDNAEYLAGWVTPQAPAVSELVGRSGAWIEAHPAGYPGTTSLHGYDGGNATAQDARNQVNALFDTLQSVYHVHYASDNVAFGHDQRIQLPQDVLKSAAPSGMCVETTAILASAVERLGMRAFIVLVPGHAFLGVALGLDHGAPISYWETSDLNGGVAGYQANMNGDNEFRTYSQQASPVRIIDVSYERTRGIVPIE